jgi:hypothetical protein
MKPGGRGPRTTKTGCLLLRETGAGEQDDNGQASHRGDDCIGAAFDFGQSADWGPYEQPKAPAGAPNILIVLYDDTGLAAWSPFGGKINMPTLQTFQTK